MYSAKKKVQALSKLLIRSGIQDIIISPGSRNAPLIIDLEARSFSCRSVTDERSAGFMGLGIAQQSRKPVVLVCTSGSAAVNYYPAIVEAFYQRIPLVVITADRPSELIDKGDGQTIRQKGVFDQHVLASCSLDGPDDQISEDDLIAISTTIGASTGTSSGPVHINVPLSEDLYVQTEEDYPLPDWPTDAITDGVELETEPFNTILSGTQKVMILCGMLPPNEDLKRVAHQWSDQPNVLVLAENISNLTGLPIVQCIDRLITGLDKDAMQELSPDVLITIGHSIVSKRIKALLRNHPPKHHWHVNPSELGADTFGALTEHVAMEPVDFLSELNPKNGSTSDYRERWMQFDQHKRTAADAHLGEIPFSDLNLYPLILEHLPKGAQLQMSNSSVIRYFQLFEPRRDLRYFSNRGVSGIDGSTSTAVGAALAVKDPVWLVTGDLSFLYDSNGLWNDHLPSNLKIIVVNNGGGSIFKIIDGPQRSGQLEKHFLGRHIPSMAKLVEHFGLAYKDADNAASAEERLEWLKQVEGPAVLEICTSDADNEEILKAYFAALK